MNLQKIRHTVLKTFKWLLISVTILLISVFFLLSLTPVQTYIAKKSARFLSEKTNYTISIDLLNIRWFDKMSANGLVVRDTNQAVIFRIDELYIDYQVFKFINSKEVELDYVSLNRPDFIVGWYSKEKYINFSRFVQAIKSYFSNPNKLKKKISPPLTVLQGDIFNGKFSYFDLRKDSACLENHFDYNYFTLDSIYGHFDDFYINKDTIQFKGRKIVGNHTDSHLKISYLNTDFLYCMKNVRFDKLEAKIGNSVIKDSISFEHQGISAYSHFNDSVHVIAKITDSYIETRDIGVILPFAKKYNDKYRLTTYFSGYIRDFYLKNTYLDFGRESTLKGDFGFSGLPNVEETFLNLVVNHAKIIPEDVKQYIGNPTFYNEGLVKMGKMDLKAKFRGYANNFVSHGEFNTQLGYFQTDVNFVLNKNDYSLSKYSGDLTTRNFDLGALLNEPKLGMTDLKVKIKPGSFGFKTETADIQMVGDIYKIDFNNYVYQNINLDARLAQNIFNGKIVADDPNLRFFGEGEINLRANQSKMDMNGKVTQLNLKPLGFSKDVIELNGNMNVDFSDFYFDSKTGTLDINKLNGIIQIDSVNATIRDDEYRLVSIDFSSYLKGSERNMSLKSNFVDASLIGDYTLEEVASDLPLLYEEYYLFFENNQEKINEYYSNKKQQSRSYSVKLNAQLKDFNPILQLADTSLQISKNTKIVGQMQRGKTTIFNVSSKPAYFKYGNYELFNNELDVNSSKMVDQSRALASIYIQSDKQRINGIDFFEKSDLRVNINDDKINFTLKSNQFDSENFIFLNGDAHFFKDSALVSFDKSYLHLLKQDWKINDANTIQVARKGVVFKDVTFSNKNQMLSVTGLLSKNPDEILNCRLRNFDVKNLKSFLNTDIGGTISGDLDLKNVYEKVSFQSRVSVQNLSINQDTLGEVRGKIDFDQKDEILHLDVDLIRDGRMLCHANGNYNSMDKKSPFDINLDADKANFNLLEPFLFGNAKDLKGEITGKLRLTGSPEQPNWQGKLGIRNGGFLLTYFNTYYRFEDQFIFDKERISCKDLRLIDTLWNTTGKVTADLDHHWFNNFSLKSNIRLDKTYVLNTTLKNNILYYGTAFGTGDIYLEGPFSNLKIWSKELTSNAGTAIFIPLEEPELLSAKEYISFIDKKDKVLINKSANSKKLNTSGIEMDINFNVTKDALFEIIFDSKAGDIIKGNGYGQINLKVDTRGDFNMFGTYTFNDGSYNFTLIDLLNKKFKIQPGSKITWNGDPYQGELGVDAVYEQIASLSGLYNSKSDSVLINTNTDMKKKFPVWIHLDLSGKLLNPNVGFDIDMKNYPSGIESYIAEWNTKFKNDDQLRNKEVFSLIVLKQFMPVESVDFSGSGAISNNLSELFTNQFSSWFSQFDENLNVSIDLSGFDAEDNGVFRVKLDYSLLDGRLRVSRDGQFSNYASANELANVLGEWTLEYLISPDGRLKMKAFNRNNISNYQQNGVNTTYGVSLVYSKSFDNLKELFKRKTSE